MMYLKVTLSLEELQCIIQYMIAECNGHVVSLVWHSDVPLTTTHCVQAHVLFGIILWLGAVHKLGHSDTGWGE